MRLAHIPLILKHRGVRWAGARAYRVAKRRFGALRRRTPRMGWADLSLESVLRDRSLADPERLADARRESDVRFLFHPGDRDRYAPLLRAMDEGDDWAPGRLGEIESGRLRYFSDLSWPVEFPPRWNDNLIEDRPGPPREHFDRLDELEGGDVKLIWEPNRFGFAFDLVRAGWRTGGDRAAEMFWTLVEDWYAHNPPNTGINWKCGQEASLRAMAWCFGLWGFADHSATTPERIAKMTQLMAATGWRIEADLGYALSQKNNHGVSEAVGLLTIGLLFPELNGSSRWVRLGRNHLERLARDLIYNDGSFSQYSANYHRVMLHGFTWAIRIAAVHGYPLSRDLIDRFDRAGQFVERIQDRATGRVPRYGQDDGAMILPLDRCAYDDFRPAAQLAAAVSGRDLPWPSGPWNEALLWMLGPDAFEQPVSTVPPEDFSAPIGGCHVLRTEDGFAFARCGTNRHHLSQLDLGHVDLWYRGENVALDAGTYSYNAIDPLWSLMPLAMTASHNTVMVDDAEQAERVSHFTLLPPPRCRLVMMRRSRSGSLAAMDLALDTYRALPDPVRLRRVVVQLGAAHWVIVDRFDAARDHDIRLHWLIADVGHQWDAANSHLRLTVAGAAYDVRLLATRSWSSIDLVRADADSARGWYAPRYHRLDPALSVVARVRGDRGILVSLFGPPVQEARLEPDRLLVIYEDRTAEIMLDDDPSLGGPVRCVRWHDGNDEMSME